MSAMSEELNRKAAFVLRDLMSEIVMTKESLLDLKQMYEAGHEWTEDEVMGLRILWDDLMDWRLGFLETYHEIYDKEDNESGFD